jgi:hypothetical protein
VVAAGLDAVPREHADAGLAGRGAEAAQRLNLPILTWKENFNEKLKPTSFFLVMEERHQNLGKL